MTFKISSDQLRSSCLRLQDMLTDATNEIDAYCSSNEWLNQIRAYINDWRVEKVLEWKETIGANEIEDQLTKIRSWTENIKNGMDKSLLTTNKILRVDTTPIERMLVPRLDKIYAEICESTVTEVFKEAQAFASQIKKIIKVLDEKPKTIEEFATYAKKTTSYKTNLQNLEAKVNLIKSLLEVNIIK